MRVLIPLALALLATGCATGYHKSGFTGGYWEKSGPGELIEVGFSGNGYIKEERVGDYLMYRCAEVARQHGGKYFTIYHSIYEAIADRPLPGRRSSSR